LNDLFYGHFTAGELKRTGVTGLAANPAGIAEAIVQDSRFPLKLYRTPGAGLLAQAAGNTAFRSKEKLRARRLRFRAVAPVAGKRTTFEKNSGTDTRTIMCGKSVDIENTA